ncbi:MAG: hypothetical protein ACOVO2_14520 [Emticicia sp.]|uniref:hypothetical protein n=1 Tax=Emticicia sp. TaxID=1930953 RepID=UPI003BA54E57
MEQNIDDFFKRKIENIQDTLPETSTFDEAALWGNIQQDLRKTKRPIWYWAVPVAACLVAIISWWILPERRSVSHTPVAVAHEKVVILPHPNVGRPKSLSLKERDFKTEGLIVMKSNKTIDMSKKKVKQTQRLDFQVASIASKNTEFSSKKINNLPDSLSFQSTIAFEKKPKVNFKTVHINEISKQGDVPFQQPRFKVQFAGKLFEKTETNYKETIQTPSIRIQ